MAMVKLVAFTSLAAPATASTIGEVSVPGAVGIADASADAAIAAAAMLSGAEPAGAEVAGEAAGAGVVVVGGAVAAATMMADGSCGAFGVETVAVSMPKVVPDLASESSAVFSDFACFDGFPAT